MQPRISDLTKTIRENRTRASGQSLVRAVTADLMRFATRGMPLSIGEVLEHFPAEQRREIELLTRADASPATTTTAGWASTLMQTAVADFLLNLGPSSAASTLLRRCLTFNFDRSASILIPDVISDANSATFVGEGAPIPVRNFSFGSGVTLKPRKFATITPFTREALSYTVGNVERYVRVVLSESVGLALDAKMFSTAAEVAGVSPAGLLLNLVGLTPSAVTPLGDALMDDVSDLVAAVAPVSGNAPVFLIAAPKQAASLRLRLGVNSSYEVFASAALSAGTVLAVASNCVACVIDNTLSFDVSDSAVLVMTDAAGSEMVAATGGVSVAADPQRSLFQTDSVALRMRFGVTWALRNATGLAFMNSVTW